jgi:hypothetical protein
MGLQEEIAKKAAQIKTDSYPMSIGELINLYRDEELDVHPEFQRIFRWTDYQKTRLIESILLGIPMPPIFVAQRKDGVWDVVDGVQRLSTILQFMGELKDEDGKEVPPLVLEGTKFLPSLKGKRWDGKNSFTRDQKLYVKRARIDVNIVLKESDRQSKYELFMRLNTGGTTLEPQEVRNCLMIMAYRQTYLWIENLAEDANFRAAISLSDQSIAEQYHMELVTRFLTFRRLPEKDLSDVQDIGDFLNERLENIDNNRKKNKADEEKAFRETFRFIFQSMEEDAFKRFDVAKQRFQGGFSISAFEAVALGVGYQVNTKGKLPAISDFRGKVESIWQNEEFTSNSGSGVRASVRIPRIVPMGRKLFSK